MGKEGQDQELQDIVTRTEQAWEVFCLFVCFLNDLVFCSPGRRAQGERGAQLGFVIWAIFLLYKVLIGSALPIFCAVCI